MLLSTKSARHGAASKRGGPLRIQLIRRNRSGVTVDPLGGQGANLLAGGVVAVEPRPAALLRAPQEAAVVAHIDGTVGADGDPVDPATLSEAAATDSICNGVRLRTRIIPAQLFTRVVFVAAATLRVLYTDGVIERDVRVEALRNAV